MAYIESTTGTHLLRGKGSAGSSGGFTKLPVEVRTTHTEKISGMKNQIVLRS